jgi:hypothetical protein
LHGDGWKWTHSYPPITGTIVSATLRIDCGDCDGGYLDILSQPSGEKIGTIHGGDNGGPGGWQCPGSWSNGADQLHTIPAAAYADLKAGNLELQLASDTGVGAWGTNRAILTITYKAPTLDELLEDYIVYDLTAAEIAATKCTQTFGSVEFSKSDDQQTLTFNAVHEDKSAAWFCDISSSASFEAVEASYTVIPIHPDTGATQDPDDNVKMAVWGERTHNDAGYFSFGTPGTIIDPGGSRGANINTETTLTFSRALSDATNVIRLGFAQSAGHEQFSINDIRIKVYARAGVKCTREGWALRAGNLQC